jgi:hypothetical protein
VPPSAPRVPEGFRPIRGLTLALALLVVLVVLVVFWLG